MARGLVLVLVAAVALTFGRMTAGTSTRPRPAMPPAAVLVQIASGADCWRETDYRIADGGNVDAFRSEWLCGGAAAK